MRCSSTTPPGRCSRPSSRERTLAALAERSDARRGDRGRARDRHGQAGRRGRHRSSRRSTARACGRCRRRRSSAARRSSARSTCPTDVLAAATDDAWLVERAGGRVAVVRGAGREPEGHDAARPALAELLLPRLRPQSCLNRAQMLTDYHVHLRPDDLDATRRRALHRGQRRALPGGGRRARDRRARRLRAHLPLRAGARRLATTRSGASSAIDDLDAYCAFVREQTDLRLGIEADFVPGARGPHGQPDRARATSTTSSARCTSSRDAPSTWTTTASGRAGAAPRRSGGATSRRSREAARSGLFDILAHPDLVKMWGAPARRPLPEGDLRRYYEPAIEAIAETRHRRRGLDRRAAQAGRRDLSGAGVPARCASRPARRSRSPATRTVPEDVGAGYDRALELLDASGVASSSRRSSGARARLAPMGRRCGG